MAATNPLRVKDLVHKYGWDSIVRLTALGIQNLAEAQVLFVDSGATNTLDADDGVHGHSFDLPLATLDYAIGLCTASEQSVILLAPGHVEDYDDSTTGFDADVAGIKIIGLGHGSLRPRFDFNHTTSKCILGANDVQIENVVLRPSVTSIVIGLEIETGITGCKIKDVEVAMGEAGDGTDEFIKAIHLVSGNHDTIFENVKILAHASAAQATHGIHVDAASDRLTFDNVIIDGPYATNGILEDAAGVNHIVVNCSVDTTGTNYGFHASSTFAKRVNNLDAGALEDAGANLIGANDADNNADTTNVVRNQDGSVLERLESIQASLDGAAGVATFPAAAVAANAVSMAEVLRYVSDRQAPKFTIKTTGDLTAFGTSKNLFTVTGDVLMRVGASVDVAVTSTSGTTTLEVGVAGNTACLCVQDAVDNTAFDVGDSWSLITAADANGAQMADEYILIGNGVTVILTGSVDDITAGDIDFYCEWIPLSSDGNVVAAA